MIFCITWSDTSVTWTQLFKELLIRGHLQDDEQILQKINVMNVQRWTYHSSNNHIHLIRTVMSHVKHLNLQRLIPSDHMFSGYRGPVQTFDNPFNRRILCRTTMWTFHWIVSLGLNKKDVCVCSPRVDGVASWTDRCVIMLIFTFLFLLSMSYKPTTIIQIKLKLNWDWITKMCLGLNLCLGP